MAMRLAFVAITSHGLGRIQLRIGLLEGRPCRVPPGSPPAPRSRSSGLRPPTTPPAPLAGLPCAVGLLQAPQFSPLSAAIVMAASSLWASVPFSATRRSIPAFNASPEGLLCVFRRSRTRVPGKSDTSSERSDAVVNHPTLGDRFRPLQSGSFSLTLLSA